MLLLLLLIYNTENPIVTSCVETIICIKKYEKSAIIIQQLYKCSQKNLKKSITVCRLYQYI